jgi:hypothetical protein
MRVRALWFGLGRLIGFAFGGIWLFALYVFTAWIVVGSLGSIQLRDALEDAAKGSANNAAEAATFDTVMRIKDDFEYKQWRLGSKLEKENPWRKVYSLETELNLLKQDIVDNAPADYVEFAYEDGPDEILQKLAEVCGSQPNEICNSVAKAFSLIDSIDTTVNFALGEDNVAFDNLEAQIEKQIEELRTKTRYTDVFVTVEFMDGWGYKSFLSEPRELLVLQLTMVMGMLGSVVAMTWSFVRWDSGVTTRRFIFLPFVGSISALIIFVFLKAGQLTIGSGSGSQELNPFFLSFVGIISGLLSERAYARMESVGRNFFSVDDEQRRWGVRLGEALATANVGPADLAAYLDVDEDHVESLIKEKSTATLPQQRLIAACVRRKMRELFTDVPPEGIRAAAEPGADIKPALVPDLVGMEAAAIEQELAAAGLRAGTVREAASTDALAGRIAHQTPAAGRQVAPGSAVDVTVSSGPPA